MTGRMRIGVDLGGTKIAVIAMDSQGRTGPMQRRPTPRTYDDTVRAIRDLVRAVVDDGGGEFVVGMAVPGSLSPLTGHLRNANSTWLNGRPLADDVARALGVPVRVENDANCFAVSESADGAAMGAASVFGVILGTGVGGGLVLNGRPLGGANGIAGEWGHVPLPSPHGPELPGVPCWCGKRNCLETWLSGPALAADHLRLTGAALTAEEIAREAAAGDAAARATLDRFLDRLARALCLVINIVDPEVIVLGGGLSNLLVIYDEIEARLRPMIFSDVMETRIVQNRHGDSSGIRGAAWLWPTTGEDMKV